MTAAMGLFATTPGTILRDQLLTKGGTAGDEKWPHKFDVYIPAMPDGQSVQFVMVALHGGSGGKTTLPQAMYCTFAPVPTIYQVNWELLRTFRCALIVPQGQHCDGVTSEWNPNGVNTVSAQNPNGVATWSNYSMWSGADDKSFLQDMAQYIVVKFGNVARVLAGHSNGGMMAYRMWLESPGWYNFYCSTSGPMPIYWDSNLAVPRSFKPFYVRYSLKDTVLGVNGGIAGTSNHFWEDVWLAQPAQYTVAAYTYPNLGKYVAGWRGFSEQADMQGWAFDPNGYTEYSEKKGWRRRYSLVDGALTMDVLSAGEHGLIEQTKDTRKSAFAVWMAWVWSQFIPI